MATAWRRAASRASASRGLAGWSRADSRPARTARAHGQPVVKLGQHCRPGHRPRARRSDPRGTAAQERHGRSAARPVRAADGVSPARADRCSPVAAAPDQERRRHRPARRPGPPVMRRHQAATPARPAPRPAGPGSAAPAPAAGPAATTQPTGTGQSTTAAGAPGPAAAAPAPGRRTRTAGHAAHYRSLAARRPAGISALSFKTRLGTSELAVGHRHTSRGLAASDAGRRTGIGAGPRRNSAWMICPAVPRNGSNLPADARRGEVLAARAPARGPLPPPRETSRDGDGAVSRCNAPNDVCLRCAHSRSCPRTPAVARLGRALAG